MEVAIPRRGSDLRGDVAVLPPPGEPEHGYYEPLLRARGIPYVAERDPLAGLLLALHHPKRMLDSIVFGVDPGREECGLTALGDGSLFYAEKTRCGEAPAAIEGVLGRIPHRGSKVYIGDGDVPRSLVEGLRERGISYVLVKERSTTSRPVLGPLAPVLRDKDLRASLTIALRGTHAAIPYVRGVP